MIAECLTVTMFVGTAVLMLRKAKAKQQASDATPVLSDEDLRKFHEDGFILIRNLISGQDLVNAQIAAKKISMITSEYAEYRALAYYSWKSNDFLKKIALNSKASKVAKELINSPLNAKSKPVAVRLLKDAFFSFAKGSVGCGWHVDKVVWPARNDESGINVWIALSPITKQQGGGLCLAKGSHNQQWARDAIPIIHGSDSSEVFQVCDMERLNIDVHNRLESMKVEYDVNPGDALIIDRWCYHRSERFHEEVDDDLVLSRYSIRYMPEDAKVADFRYNGFGGPYLEGKDGHELRLYPELFPLVS